eukprot:g3096.t1
MPVPKDWKTKYKKDKKTKKMVVSHWQNQYTKEKTKKKPLQSRIPMITEAWQHVDDDSGRKIWRNKITTETSTDRNQQER